MATMLPSPNVYPTTVTVTMGATNVLNDVNLSATFGVPLTVRHEDGRWSARRRVRHR